MTVNHADRCPGRHLASALLCAASLFAAMDAVSAQASPPAARDARTETAMKITAPFIVSAVGDLLSPQPLRRSDPGFLSLIDRIRKSDVGFGNLESSLIDFSHFQGPVAGSQAPLATGDALQAMGFNLLNTANNHSLDGGVAGMISTNEALDRLGIVHAGTGMNLQDARAARYLETPKGRVGLIGIFSVDDASFVGPSFSKTEATYRNGNLGGAPGVNPLHLTNYHVVSPEQLQSLKDIARTAYGERAGSTPPAVAGRPDRFRFFDEWYEAGPDPGALHYDMNPGDERDILQSVRNAKIYADFLIVTIHAHQATNYRQQGAGGVDHDTPDFLVRLAHASIDNGADLFVAHGVHALHGVEIYNGKPVFYGTSNFIFQTGLQFGASYDILANNQAAMENPASHDGLLTTSRFENGRLAEVRLYPVELGGTRRPLSQMGVPTTPTADEAQRILRDLQEYSKPFGTKIAIEDNVGVIRIGR